MSIPYKYISLTEIEEDLEMIFLRKRGESLKKASTRYLFIISLDGGKYTSRKLEKGYGWMEMCKVS